MAFGCIAPSADDFRASASTQVRPQELIGVQRDTAWNDISLARAPEVAKYAERAGRTIPVAVLEPVQGPLRDAGNID